MNLFGLEGSGFLIAVCLTLMLSGMIVFYVRQKFNETDHKIQHMLGIVQQLNANNIPKPQEVRMAGGSVNSVSQPPPTVNDGVHGFTQEIDMNLLTNMPPIPEEREHKISISESSEISSTTDVDEDDFDEDEDEDNDSGDESQLAQVENDDEIDLNEKEEEVEILDAQELEEDVKVVDELPSGNKVINIESLDAIELDDFSALPQEENTTDSDENEVKIESDNLDSMLLGMLDTIGKKNNETKKETDDIHVIEINNLTENQNLNELKVTELRQMIKDKGMKVQNLSKLKKNECLELLAE